MNQNESTSSAVGSAEELEFSYTLTADNIYRALKTSRIYRKNFIKAIIESGVLAGLVILFGVWWIVWDDGNAMIFCIACACLIGLVWAAVLFSVRNTCNRLVTGDSITMTLGTNTATVRSGLSEPWTFPLDGSVVCEEKNDLLVLHTGPKEWLLLPLSSIAEGKRDLVHGRLLQATKPFVK